MNNTDIRFSKGAMALLNSLVGKKLKKIAYIRMPYSSECVHIVVLSVDEKMYELTNTFKDMDYFGDFEEVAVFDFRESDLNAMETLKAKGSATNPYIETPVCQKISEIRIMNESQQLYCKGEQTYNVDTVRGIVFVMEDGREISFEKDIWFFETIEIRTGHNLMDEYASLEECFLDDWTKSDKYEARGNREVVTLK